MFITSPQITAQTERETRAVWVATNFRLDWPPPTFDEEKQKQALIDIFDDIKSKNLNTVFFQAGINGTVLFKSSFDPFSPYITGEVDKEGNYDPLQFAIEQAHKRGLEIHPWQYLKLGLIVTPVILIIGVLALYLCGLFWS